MHKNTQNVEWETWSKILCHSTWLLQGSGLTFQFASPVASVRFDSLAKTNFSLAGHRQTEFSWTDKYKVFSPLILSEPPSKLQNWRQCRFMFFTNKILCSTLVLNVGNIGVHVIIIGIPQQQKSKFSLPWEILTELRNLQLKNNCRLAISHEQNNLFHTSCKHRHRYYIGII